MYMISPGLGEEGYGRESVTFRVL